MQSEYARWLCVLLLLAPCAGCRNGREKPETHPDGPAAQKNIDQQAELERQKAWAAAVADEQRANQELERQVASLKERMEKSLQSRGSEIEWTIRKSFVGRGDPGVTGYIELQFRYVWKDCSYVPEGQKDPFMIQSWKDVFARYVWSQQKWVLEQTDIRLHPVNRRTGLPFVDRPGKVLMDDAEVKELLAK